MPIGRRNSYRRVFKSRSHHAKFNYLKQSFECILLFISAIILIVLINSMPQRQLWIDNLPNVFNILWIGLSQVLESIIFLSFGLIVFFIIIISGLFLISAITRLLRITKHLVKDYKFFKKNF